MKAVDEVSRSLLVPGLPIEREGVGNVINETTAVPRRA
jgi:hypothetical protein